MLPLEIMLPIDFTAVLCWAQHHCTVLHLVGVLHWCCPILWGTTSSSPPQCCTHVQYSSTPYWSSSSSPYCGAKEDWGQKKTEGEVNMLHCWSIFSCCMVSEVLRVSKWWGGSNWAGGRKPGAFFWFLDFCQSQVPIWATKIKICKNCKFSEIFGNFRKFWPIFAIFGHFWPFGSASWAFWPEKWKFLILLWKNCYFGCGPCGPGGPPGPLGPPGPWCKSIFSPI